MKKENNLIIDKNGKPTGCSCGAECEPKDRLRFVRRHPKLCSEERIYTPSRTRSVDYDDRKLSHWEKKHAT